jgi:hypothetical protein
MPTSAQAQNLPQTLELETCWYGVCAGIYSRYHRIVPNPILAPDSGELWNSQGLAGFYTFDPFDSSIQLFTINFPIGIYDGSFVGGCLSGTTGQVYYGGYGDFIWQGCP